MDMVQLLKIIYNITYVGKDIVPKVKTRKSTKSGDKIDGTLVLEEQLCRTCTYARSYMVRSKRVWNTLPANYQQKCAGTLPLQLRLRPYLNNITEMH